VAEFAEVLLNLPIDRGFTYRIRPEQREAVRPGARVRVPFGPRTIGGYVSRLLDRADFPRIREIEEVFPDASADERTLELARWVSARYGCSWGEALAATIPAGVRRVTARREVRMISAGEGEPGTAKQKETLAFARTLSAPLPLRDFAARSGASTSTVGAMVKAGLLRERLVPPELDAMADAVVEKPKAIAPTPEQEAALAAIERGGVVLLHGVTGSGKTEVYLRAIAREVARGRQAIVLVPEIALTPQTVARFKARFPRVAVLHSLLSEADRARQWRAARAGEVDVVVGARSAVFAPVKSLGLIVLDEEHEGAYKQENVPRYHAREVAVERGRREGAAVVLGSATPSLESLHKARSGEYRLARLPRRVEGRPLPEIEVVDMAAEEKELKRRPIVSRRLEALLRQSLERGEQAILFLNRRGFLTHVSCPRCGWLLACRRCDVALTYHRERDRALCHYCAEPVPLPPACPDCGFGGLKQYGTGTEKIESEMKRMFPEARVGRMDSDSMKTRGDYKASIGAFWGGRTDILVGTQMIAKGLDVPDVTLVGVVSADTAFHVPDFRAAERTFQTITQVAGRTGRGPRGGRVVVQTMHPQHYAVKAAATYDLEGFLAQELELRREHGYPPFVSLVRVLVQGSALDRVEKAAEALGDRLRAVFPEDRAKVLGPATCPFSRLKGRHRMHLLVKAPELDPVLPAIRKAVEAAPSDRALQASLDVDPVNLL